MMVRGGLAAVLVGCGVLLAGPAPAAPLPTSPAASAADAGPAQFGPGDAVLPYVEADPAVVRAVGQIPRRWKLALTPSGKATVFLDMTSAPVTVAGHTRRVTYTALFTVLDSTALPSPERNYAHSNVEGSPEDVYLIAWNVDGKDFANWLRDGTGLGTIVHDDPGQRFTMPSLAGLHDFAFGTRAGSPQPVQLAATLTDAMVPVYPSITDWWRQTPDGTVKIEDAVPSPASLQFRFVETWNLRTTVTSVLGTILGRGDQQFTCGPTTAPAPLLGVVTHQNAAGCLGGHRYDAATFTKTLIHR